MEKITVEVMNETKMLKERENISWRGLIMRGLESLKDAHTIAQYEQQIKEKDAKIERLAGIIEQIMKKPQEVPK